MNAGDLVLRLLSSIGRPREATIYLSQFRSEKREQFATIVAPPCVIEDQLDALAADLSLLDRLALSPVVALATADDVAALTGAVDAARAATIEDAAAAAHAGAIPVVHAAGDALLSLVGQLDSHKVVLLDDRRGLTLESGEVPSLIDVTSELPELLPELVPDQRHLAELAAAMLACGGRKMTVSVTSPLNLLHELFTVRGAGTLLRNAASVASHAGYESVDIARLGALMESAFGKPAAGGFFDRDIERVYVAGDYDGAALVAPTALAPYLTKFAVGLRARGEGIGRDLWRALFRDYARLFWRARADNPVAAWYEQQCDGMARMGRWQVFWRGLEPADLPRAIELATNAPADF